MMPLGTHWLWVGAASLVAVLAGCSESSSPAAPASTTGAGGNDDGGHSSGGGSGGTGGSGIVPGDCGFTEPAPARVDIAERVGLMLPGYASVDGRLADKPWPSQYAVVVEAGPCRYLEADYELCDPPCESGQMCTVGGICESFPQTVSAGTLTAGGLAVPVSIESQSYDPGLYWGPAGLPVDLFGAGDPIEVSFAGDTWPAFALHTVGVAPLESPLEHEQLVFVDGQDAEVVWTAGPDPDACVELWLDPGGYGHGQPNPFLLWCVGPDTGELLIPRQVVDPFPHSATPPGPCTNSSCPPAQLTRFRRATASVPAGEAQLVVRHTVQFAYAHPPP